MLRTEAASPILSHCCSWELRGCNIIHCLLFVPMFHLVEPNGASTSSTQAHTIHSSLFQGPGIIRVLLSTTASWQQNQNEGTDDFSRKSEGDILVTFRLGPKKNSRLFHQGSPQPVPNKPCTETCESTNLYHGPKPGEFWNDSECPATHTISRQTNTQKR